MIWKLTALGDTALLMPVSLIVLLCLLAQRQGGAALAWASALVTCAVLIVGSKLAFSLCGSGLDSVDIRSPSGHASVGTTFYGSLALLVGSGRAAWQKAVVGFLAALLIGVVGVTRLMLEVHSVEEVVVGYLIGALCVGLFALLDARAGWPRIRLRWLLAGSVVALVLLGGLHVGFEHRIREVSRWIGASFDICR